MTPDPWLEPATARAYVQFCDRFHRYSDSSQWLVEAALSVEARGVLDWGAGTGVTTKALLARAHPEAMIWTLEPSEAMAQAPEEAPAMKRVTAIEQLPAQSLDVVVGNSMWWLLPNPVGSLRELTTHLKPGAVVAWSTPALYLGEPPSAPELRLHSHLCEVLARFEVSPVTGPADALLDPEAALSSAGFEVQAHLRRERQCTAEEWLAHMSLPPLWPEWMRRMEPERRRALTEALQEALRAAPAHRQGWYITVGRWYTGAVS